MTIEDEPISQDVTAFMPDILYRAQMLESAQQVTAMGIVFQSWVVPVGSLHIAHGIWLLVYPNESALLVAESYERLAEGFRLLAPEPSFEEETEAPSRWRLAVAFWLGFLFCATLFGLFHLLEALL